MTDWNKLKVVDLKVELKKRGLAQTGLKPQLVARLTAAESEETAGSEPTTQGDVPKADLGLATAPDNVEPAPKSDSDSQTASTPIDQAVQPQGDSNDLSTSKSTPDVAKQSAVISDSSKPPSQADDHTSALSSVEPQEAIEDRQRRKRRSLTPPISADETARKRFRTSRNATRLAEEEVATSADSILVEKHKRLDQDDENAASREPAPSDRKVEPAPTIADSGREDAVAEEAAEGQHPTSEFEAASPARRRDSRFKGLFEAPQQTTAMEEPASRESVHDVEDQPDHFVDPAIHPATSALYIRDFMRPLNQLQLKSHLAALATPTNREVDQDLVVNFYIDLIRTHAFVSFRSISAAVRVRSALHGSVWPAERNRKPLWVDFVPSDKVDDWIDQEKSFQAGGRSVAKKWEVVYHNIDSDQPIEATLEEASDHPTTRPAAARQPSIPGPSGAFDSRPAREFERPLPEPPAAPPAPNPEPRATNSFSTLDHLFNSTTTRPVLYWQPVSKSLANERLDSIDNATSKDASERAGGDINRYTFEDGDVLVDRGPEIFSGIRPPPGYRGPARGGGSRGGFSSRGGRGGTYDSYRGDGGPRNDDRRDRRDSRDDRYYY